MKIQPIQVNNYLTPKITGYAATTGIVLSIISGISKNKNLKKTHKPLAYISALLTALHVGLIEYNHYKWKKNNKVNN